jgi:hypothetical protein
MSQQLEHAAAFATWLHTARCALQLTRRQFAAAAGLSEIIIRMAESGRYVLLAKTTAKIVRAVAARDKSLAAKDPSLELGQIVVRPKGDRLVLQIELDLATLLHHPAGLTLAIVGKKRD